MKPRPRRLHRHQARRIQAEKEHPRLISIHHIRPHIDLGEKPRPRHPRKRTNPHPAHPERHHTNPRLPLKAVDLQPRRNQRPQHLHRHRPMRKQQVMPPHLHRIRPIRQRIRAVLSMVQINRQKINRLPLYAHHKKQHLQPAPEATAVQESIGRHHLDFPDNGLRVRCLQLFPFPLNLAHRMLQLLQEL